MYRNISLEAATSYTAYKVGSVINLYYLPFVILLGLVGNTLSFLVMTQRQNRHISCCVYMAGLAISDNGMLIIAFSLWIITEWVGRFVHPILCCLPAWLMQSLSCYGVSVVFMVTLDRCLAIKYPYKGMTWRTPSNARRTVIILAFISLLLNLPFYFISRLDKDGTHCSAFSVKSTLTKCYAAINIITLCLVPFGAILTMNSILIQVIRERAQIKQEIIERRSLGSIDIVVEGPSQIQDSCDANSSLQSKPSSIKVKSREVQLTAILISISFALLTLTLPQYIRYAMYLFIDKDTNPVEYANYFLFYNISQKLYFTNNACNFYLYCLGSTKFRLDCKHLFNKSVKGMQGSSECKLQVPNHSRRTSYS